MKKQLALTSILVGLTSTLIFSGCNSPVERESVVNPKIAANLFELKDLNEITGDKAQTVYSSSGKMDLSQLNAASLKQAKVEGKVADLLGKLSAHKDAVDSQLESGAIALVVLDDQIKILKVTKETTALDAMSLTYMQKLKALSRTSDAREQTALQAEISSLKNQCPAELNETYGLVELAALQISSYGVLDNERTDYGEKKSILNISPKPFQFATHILVTGEVGADDASAEAPAQ